MSKKLKIPPYGNFEITKDAEESVTPNENQQEPQAGEFDGQKMLGILKYNSGESRVVFMLPIASEGDTYVSAFPHPVLLYLSSSIGQLDLADKIRGDLKLYSLPASLGNVRMLDSSLNETNVIYNAYLSARVASVVMLNSTVEAFVNSIIPEDLEFPMIKKNKTVVYKAEDADRWLTYKEKLTGLLLHIKQIELSITDPRMLNDLLALYRLRNDFIHLKSRPEPNLDSSHTTLFNNMLNLDMRKYVDVVIQFINLVEPGYVKWN